MALKRVYFAPLVKLLLYILKRSNIDTYTIINFPFVSIGKLIVLGLPIFKHMRVINVLSKAMNDMQKKNVYMNM